jgi:hypothetical protein
MHFDVGTSTLSGNIDLTSSSHPKEVPIWLLPPGGACRRVLERPVSWLWIRWAWLMDMICAENEKDQSPSHNNQIRTRAIKGAIQVCIMHVQRHRAPRSTCPASSKCVDRAIPFVSGLCSSPKVSKPFYRLEMPLQRNICRLDCGKITFSASGVKTLVLGCCRTISVASRLFCP